MKAWRRWQDYATMLFGVILLAAARELRRTDQSAQFVLGENSHHVATVSAYVLGALLVVAGIVAAATREPRRSLIVNAPGLVAVITLIAALVLGFSGAAGLALTAGVMAIATVLAGATLRRSAKA